MKRIWFTSDHHFGHKNILKYTNRPFTSVHEMNKALTENWNNTVGENDTVYYLGDFGLTGIKNLESIYNRLNGKKILVPGNHDPNRVHRLFDGVVIPLFELRVDGEKHPISLCHFPMRSWNGSHRGAIHLHGHSHGDADFWGGALDVGVDSIANLMALKINGKPEERVVLPEYYKPVSLDEVKMFIVLINGYVAGTRATGSLHHENNFKGAE